MTKPRKPRPRRRAGAGRSRRPAAHSSRLSASLPVTVAGPALRTPATDPATDGRG